MIKSYNFLELVASSRYMQEDFSEYVFVPDSIMDDPEATVALISQFNGYGWHEIAGKHSYVGAEVILHSGEEFPSDVLFVEGLSEYLDDGYYEDLIKFNKQIEEGLKERNRKVKHLSIVPKTNTSSIPLAELEALIKRAGWDLV